MPSRVTTAAPSTHFPMNFFFRIAPGLSGIFVLTAVTVHGATSTVPAGSAAEPVMLSPFEVSTERDTGFVASSALAGGRLNLELKDVPAAYSVITRDFIDAIGITNL